jgi:predicted NBD/HSP70 family sugar kinase
MRHTRTITPTEMRVINRSAILDLIRRESPISRSVIAERLDVSLPTVMRIVDDLINEGLVRSMGTTEWSGGRRRSLLEFNSRGQVMIGVDLGRTEFYGAVADLGGNLLNEQFLPHPGPDGEAAYARLVELLEKLLAQAHHDGVTIRGIGVGVPGITDYEQGSIRLAASLDWKDFPLRKGLMERFNLPVIVDNDVNLSALGELWFGAEQNVDSLVLLSVGTGIGAGIILDGAIFRGAHQAAGEVGYMLPGREFLNCPRGMRGALEDMASVPGILAQGCAALESLGDLERMRNLCVENVFEARLLGEPWAVDVINQATDSLALAVANIALSFDPNVIILGGDLSDRFGILVQPILERVRSAISWEGRLGVSTLGRRAAVMGAITNVLHQTADYYVLRSMA